MRFGGSEHRSLPLIEGFFSRKQHCNAGFGPLISGGRWAPRTLITVIFEKESGLGVAVEHRGFVGAGRRYFENERLVNVDGPNRGRESSPPVVTLFSSSHHYVENPVVLQNLLDSKPKFAIFDRIKFHEGADDFSMVQSGGRKIYRASFQAGIF